MDNLTPDQRKRNMQAIKSKGTQVELVLAKALWQRGFRYRKHNKAIIGAPDFSSKKLRVAIFVDGEFFHGKDWQIEKLRIKSNRKYWWKKIERNIQRDAYVNTYLESEGWTVIRFWSTEITADLLGCLKKIEDCVNLKMKQLVMHSDE